MHSKEVGGTLELIRTRQQRRCALCGGRGEPLYSEQQDRLFGASGSWNLTKCSERQCGLIWLNPLPLAEDIGKAYANYYTHRKQGGTGQAGLLNGLYRWMKGSYLEGKYGYKMSSRSGLFEWLGKLLYLFPVRRSDVDATVRYLRALPQGRLLDVGCGSGDWLLFMRELGWQVEGLEFDEISAKRAVLRGIRARCGVLEAQDYPDECFDAVALNHVIEHVPNPVATLVECRRILKKTGKLVVATPNSASLGHRIFKQHWRGLEPPRHLHVFCPNSMGTLLKLAGFAEPSIRTVNSGYIWEQSLRLWIGTVESAPGLGISLVTKVVSHVCTMIEQALLVVKPEIGECIVVETYGT